MNETKEIISNLKIIQQEMLSADMYCQDCVGDCHECKRYKCLEKAINFIENTPSRLEQLEKENKELKNNIMNAMGVIYRDFEYDDGDFENQRFQQDILKELRGDNRGARKSN